MKLTFKIALLMSIIFLVLFLLGGTIIHRHQNKILLEQARVQAEALFRMLVITRQWVSDNSDVVSLVPAEVTKELSLYADEIENFKFHITSDQLVNPENAPDDFEKRAMALFKKGAENYSEWTEEGDSSFFRYMAPLYVNQSCLQCHDYQGYEIGDFRGGISIQIPLSDLKSAFYSNNIFFLSSTVVMYLAMILGISLLLYVLVLKPLRRMKETVTLIAEGDYKARMALQTRDELEDLSVVFDNMSTTILKNEDTLKSELAKLSGQYDDVLKDLRLKNQQLESVSHFKSSILDSISHEVRTPMTKILSYAEIMEKPQFLQDQSIQEQSIAVIKRSIRQLRDLFNNVLTLNRLDHAHELQTTACDPGQLLEEQLSHFNNDLENQKISIEWAPAEPVQVPLDENLFKYVLTNLISNAIKYNYPEGIIRIEEHQKRDRYCLTFWNTGPGIPQEECPNLADRFFRGSNVKKEYPGTGLGLSIVKRIVEMHKGTLYIQSEVERYAEFKICLPTEADERATQV